MRMSILRSKYKTSNGNAMVGMNDDREERKDDNKKTLTTN